MNREAPVLKFDYRLRNDYCTPIIDYGKNLIITPLLFTQVRAIPLPPSTHSCLRYRHLRSTTAHVI